MNSTSTTLVRTERTEYDALKYVACTYGLFVLLLATLGAVAVLILDGTPIVMRSLTIITAWTPTYSLLLMFRKLCPGTTLKDFYRRAFGERLNGRLVITTTVIQVVIFALSASMVSIKSGDSVMSLLDLSASTVVSGVFFSLMTGATGEESGWRGYLSPVIEEKLGVIKGSFIVGVIWAFWHAPIWFLGTGLEGTDLLRYIIAFVVGITSLGFVMGICHHWCRNLLVPVCLHFMFNFLLGMYTGPEIDMVSWYAVFYALGAAGLFIFGRTRLERADNARMVH